jgi:hypothetical protein
MAVDPCQVVDTLAAFQLDVLKRINKKFTALRSLAGLLEQLGELSDLVPNIGRLIPVVNIDLALYENLVANCPWLNLPPATTGDLNQLQAMVTGAYANMINKLLRHPWNRMGQLQDQLDDFLGQIQGDVNSAMTQAADFLRCLQTVCAAGRAAVGQLNAIKDADIAAEIDKFTDNFVKDAGQVMTEGMKTKYQQLQDAKLQLEVLGGDVGKDYADAKAALGQ